MIRANLVTFALFVGFLSLGCGGSNQPLNGPSSANAAPHTDLSDPAGAGMTQSSNSGSAVGTGGTGSGYGAGADSGSGGH
jgi:hypothetical protein